MIVLLLNQLSVLGTGTMKIVCRFQENSIGVSMQVKMDDFKTVLIHYYY